MNVTPIPPEIERDRWGRPLVYVPGAEKPIAYTRCTTYVGCVEDTYNLSKWQQRMTALGLSQRPDLALSVAAHRDDKSALNRICEDAIEAAGASAAATTGTALHALTEQMDRGLDLGVVPEEYLPDLAAYAEATKELKHLHIESFCVQDMLKVGGTPDRVVKYRGKRYIADLKTGELKYGFLKIAAQLAMYSRSRLYDVATRERSLHEAELDKGIVIHLPVAENRERKAAGEPPVCTLYWIDLHEGWEVVKLARDIRAARAKPFSKIVTGIGVEDPTPASDPAPVAPTLADLITSQTTRDGVTTLWRERAPEWTEEHTELAKSHLATLA